MPSRASLSAILLIAGASGLGAQISVGANAQVSGDMKQAAHTEYFADADPADPSRLVVCSMIVDPTRSRLSTGLYLSTSSGASWRLAVHDTTSKYGSSWDPACVFGPGGIIHFGSIPTPTFATEPRGEPVNRYVRSLDGGRSWEKPVFTPFLDNEDLAIDWTGGPLHGRIYSIGVSLSDSVPGRRHISLFHSTDSGRTYQGPVIRFPANHTDQGNVGAPVVLRDGRLMVPVVINRVRVRTLPGQAPVPVDSLVKKIRDTIPENAASVVFVEGGGTRIGAPQRVASFGSCRTNSGPPEVAVDRSAGPFRDRMYMVYIDGAYGRCQVMLAWSDDGSKWSAPLGVDDPRVPLDSLRGPDAFFPLVRVNNRGVVGITWYDRREDPGNFAFRQRFTASLDGGESVMPSVAVSTSATTFARGDERETYFGLGGRSRPAQRPAPATPPAPVPATTPSRPSTAPARVNETGKTWLGVATGPAYRTYDMVGDYGGMAVRTDGVFHPVWIDNRSGVPQLYTAPVTVAGEVRRSAERDALVGRNVTDSVVLVTTSTVYDAKTCTISLGLDLLNRSGGALRLPLVIRLNKMLSQFGAPRADGPTDDLGRPLLRVGATGGTLARDGATSLVTHIRMDDCVTLGGAARFSRRSDSRLETSPVANIAGPKMLAIEASVFELRQP